ncbi:MAG: hypothetical protein JNL74_16110, partial [Fibrobacteres bacterium]|nr:hypothetical protein [Fibrobacterota bacterium]
MIGKFFSVPETAAAIDIRDGRIHYLVIDRSGRIIKERVADSSDVPAFVAKYGLLNIVVSTSPNETEVLSKYVDSALCAGKSHDDLINEHLPKVIEPDSVTLETVELGSVTLLNFMHNKSEETLYKLLTDSGLLVDRIGGGTCEMGIALQKHFAGFTGAF